MAEPFGPEDIRVLAQYEFAAQGAWTNMPDADKQSYLKIHKRLSEITTRCLQDLTAAGDFEACSTLGFNPSGGVRGNRPKDLWCAIFPRGAEAYMPQVYLIVSHRGVELGYAAAIHSRDFSDSAFKKKLKSLAPRIFDALPEASSDAISQLSRSLTAQGRWWYRKKTRLAPNEQDFASLEDLITYLKSGPGKEWGAGTVSRYWLPHELSSDVDLSLEFFNAARMFTPLIVRTEPQKERPYIPAPTPLIEDLVKGTSDSIQGDLERFMSMYPEKRNRPFATDQELWSVLSGLQGRCKNLSSVLQRPTLQVTWSVGQGNWARVPWIAFLDTRVTDTTQRGIYGVLLFREDMSGVYLTLNQGVTEPKRIHGASSGLQLLRENAGALRSACAELESGGFSLDGEIDLRTDGTLGRDYEAATIAYKLYERGRVPSDEAIISDVEALLKTYESLVSNSQENPSADTEGGRKIPPPAPYVIEDALSDLFLEREELEDLLALWRAKKNLIIQGPPGVGKTYVSKRLAYLLMGSRDAARTRMVQFHQAYAYEDFIQGYRPTESGGFVRRDGAFFDFAKLAEADEERIYVFIIDEINRGNLSKILGELMMLIEPDKRGQEFAIPLAYSRSDDAPFSVPPNLFLMGLMNTADRSLAMVDYALRRRFSFHTLEPRYSSVKFRTFLTERKVDPRLIEVIAHRMSELNEEIASDTLRLGPGYCVGHSFFVSSDPAQLLDESWYRRTIRSEIAPLLREYCFDGGDKAEEWISKLLKTV